MGIREEYLWAVRARLEQVSAAGDVSLVLEPGALAAARRLADVLHDDDGDLQARLVLGWFHYYRYQALPEGQDNQDLAVALMMFVPCFVVGVDGLPEPLLPFLAELAADTATDVLQRAIGSADLELISAAVALWRRILDAIPASHASRASYLTNLGVALRTRFGRAGARADLDAAIDVIGAALQATPADRPERARMLSELGAALRARFERAGEQADLEAAIDTNRAAVQATPADDPDRGARLNNLGNALRSRFRITGGLADIDETIKAIQAAVDTAPAGHPNRPMRLSNLGGALQARFEHTEVLADLDAAIDAAQAAVETTATSHPNRPVMLSNRVPVADPV